jgi:hypothetical protein
MLRNLKEIVRSWIRLQEYNFGEKGGGGDKGEKGKETFRNFDHSRRKTPRNSLTVMGEKEYKNVQTKNFCQYVIVSVWNEEYL